MANHPSKEFTVVTTCSYLIIQPINNEEHYEKVTLLYFIYLYYTLIWL